MKLAKMKLRWAGNLLLMFFGIFAAFLIGEISLRLIGYSNLSFHTFDDTLGRTLRPDTEGLYNKEGKAYVKINSDGLRDVEHTVAKPDNVFRIAVLGDSYTEGLQLDLDKLFWKVLENRLNSCPEFNSDKKIEVINFGVSGYGTGLELLMLRKKVWKYHPDMVILAFLTGNDVRDNSKELNRIDYVPYFELNENGKLVLDRSYLESSGYKMRSGLLADIMYQFGNHVRLMQLANDVRHGWRTYLLNKEISDKNSQVELGLDNHVYLPPKSEVWKKAWAVTEALLLQMKQEIENKHSRFLLVSWSSSMQVTPSVESQNDFMAVLGVDNLFYPDMRIQNFSQKHDIEVLTLAPELAKIATAKKIHMHGFKNTVLGGCHWNENGHRFAGKLIAEHFCKDDK